MKRIRGGSRNSGEGGVDFFFKGMGFRGRLRVPSWARANAWVGPRGRSPRKFRNFSEFMSKI